METTAKGEAATKSKWRRWIARFGVLGFCFFLIKGLLWLAIPAIVVAVSR